ncbi:Homoserine kinase [Brucella suis bv. 2]|nr:Homoserine kinase [Brucella suis bv. 2]AIB23407.1 Homoserine kinase [Brucella suis bv. 2]AIB26764.1 Homoserine kinase [Brucella suis bv. 2]AIB30161.1 Homoserine kinase [Brucella suis bv. 2]AIB33534.1 Homoserine kinase [Brucella suis bv. 2]
MEKCLDHLTQRVSAALAFWGLPEQMPELLKYRENAVFKVRLRDGNPAALRLHRPGYHARAALVSELAWMDDLRKHAIAVPQPLAALDGAFLVALVSPDGATCHADLIGWVEGEPLGETGTPLSRHGRDLPAVFHAIGGEMARMHEAADGFSRPAGFERPAWDVAGLLGDAPFWRRNLTRGLFMPIWCAKTSFCATARWHSSILMIAASGFACSIWRPCFCATGASLIIRRCAQPFSAVMKPSGQGLRGSSSTCHFSCCCAH